MSLRQPPSITCSSSVQHWIGALLLCPLLLSGCTSRPLQATDESDPGRWSQLSDPSPSRYDLVYYHEDEAYFRDRPHQAESINAVAIPWPQTTTQSHLRLSMKLGEAANNQHLQTQPRQKTFSWPASKPALSPGDRIVVRVENGEEFSGNFEVDVDGSINLPYLPAIQVAGTSLFEARKLITQALINAGYFRSDLLAISVLVQQWSAIQVHVTGAVFSPGMVSVNVRRPEDRALKLDQVSGDFPSERFVSAALRAAGGIRPDADLHRILLVRQGRAMPIDLSGVPAGLASDRYALVAGDQLIVPSTGRFDEGLVRPSAVTPPGIRVFLSNLTVPATDNSKSAVNNFSSGLPYGTRFLSGLISANCVGGTSATNSRRYGVLVTRNPLTGETEVIERSIQKMLEMPEREALNPHLMPNDGIACYDSGVTNLRDIGRTISDIISPFR